MTLIAPPVTRRGVLARFAGWSQTHHWWALALWVVALVGITATSTAVGDDYRNDFTLPGTQSQALLDSYEQHFPEQSGDTITVVVHSETGLAGVRPQVDALVTDLAGLDHVAAVTPPEPRGGTVSGDGTTGLATVVLDQPAGHVATEDLRAIVDTGLGHDGDGLRVELTGDAVREVQESEAGGGAEGAGMLAALVILVFLFGSLLAASLPLITAIFAVGTTLGLVALASHVATIPDYTAPVLVLVGLGVGIDYALLVFSRYRGELVLGADRATATRTALGTAGRSVLFAGATVIIALLGLYVLGLGALQGIALSVTLTVLMTMLASLTLLPSLLTIFGGRLERTIRRRAEKAGREHWDGWRRCAT